MSYCHTGSSEAAWTPVVAKRRKKFPVPHYVRHRFPPDHPIHAQSANSDLDTDSGSDCDIGEMTPSETVSVHYREIDGTLDRRSQYIPLTSFFHSTARDTVPCVSRSNCFH